MIMTHDDMFRAMLRGIASIDMSTAAHQEQIKIIAAQRRQTIRDMVALAAVAGETKPQLHVAKLLGISQQRVSKIINNR
jgi:DNA-directed RNA polymerase specialized sigma subunit